MVSRMHYNVIPEGFADLFSDKQNVTSKILQVIQVIDRFSLIIRAYVFMDTDLHPD